MPVGDGRASAAGVPGAQFVELPGGDHPPYFGNSAAILDAIDRWRRS